MMKTMHDRQEIKRRVVVTGIGVISSIGNGKNDFWAALAAGRSGVDKIERFDSRKFRIKNAYEVKNLDLGRHYDEDRILKMGRTSQLAVIAAKMALDDAGLPLHDIAPEQMGVSVGSGLGESEPFEKICKGLLNSGQNDDKLFYQYPYQVLGNNLASEFRLAGENSVFGSACAAGSYAIGHAFDLIERGEQTVLLAGGADSISQSSIAYFSRVSMTPPNQCQPFDRNRKGVLLGEGAGMMVLESLEHALSRKAHIYAEIVSYGLSCDAFHFTTIEVNGVADAIEKALTNSHVAPEDVDYICAHGTGTPLNDKVETQAIKKVYGESAGNVPISSIKSMIGHTSGASGAIAVIATVLAFQNGLIPPTINYETKDPECDLDYVPNIARKQEIEIAQINAFGFGGNNCSLLLKKISAPVG
jgi:3-oxoacyl-[acyl-carrier-protein] synthase II